MGRSNGIIVNIPQRMLFNLVNGEVTGAYPIAPGKPDWQTPLGEFIVVTMEKDKTWFVPPSIQEEMREEGKPVLTEVPPGPDNPLGRYWTGLSLPAIGIHGTIAPTSLYDFRSHGCIRLNPDDVEALFTQTRRGTPGDIVYQPLLFGQKGGRVFLEVHRDVYRRGSVSLKAAQQLASALGLFERVDWTKATEALKVREGVARDVTLDQQIMAENLN
jgi:L,D-transpeptidase ErfK/SrfK